MITLLSSPAIHWAVTAAVVAWTICMIRKNLFTHSVTISKSTDQEESIVFNVNFSKWESAEAKANKLAELYKIAEDRRDYCHQRFMKLIEEESAKKEGLKAVK